MDAQIALGRFTTEIIPFKWRVQSHVNRKNIDLVRMIAYIDARDVAEKLDEVVGPENWSDEYYELKGRIFCKISIRIDGEFVGKSDVGTASSGTEKEKSEASDAFKRAAVKWGINRAAYRIGIIELNARQYGKNWIPVDAKGRFMNPEEVNK